MKDAYSACINTAEGNPDKVQACQSVLNVLKEDKQHQQFATQESVRVLDYQQCILATRTGNDQAVKARCDQIWKEIRSNNNDAIKRVTDESGRSIISARLHFKVCFSAG
ncbi:Uncharacterised protein [Raoultella terrigena]|uniref:Uncharacterized protein n=1 Tax=Raoultella terrigena TaxID=577 RepID=A0A4U9DFW6_RAOTE|nr:Uncharacterised protein [Raoultella terrigena]